MTSMPSREPFDPAAAPTLLAEPAWDRAAQALVDGCADLPDEEDRVALIAAVGRGLGDALYPALLRVLALVGRHGDYAARAAVAGALVHGLQTGRLPAGRIAAWGANDDTVRARGFGGARRLGPIEYLCLWHAQAGAPDAPDAAQFEAVACALLDLLDANPHARHLYGGLLIALADDPIDGTMTRQSREALRALAIAWTDGASAAQTSSRFLAALQPQSGGGLAGMRWRLP